MGRARLVLVCLTFVLASAAARKLKTVGDQPDFDYFYLVRQWPGTFCSQHACPLLTERDWARFTIHGLWPNYADGTWPEFCDKTQPFDADSIDDLLHELELVWPSYMDSSDSEEFWAHEWNKHGTCALKELPSEHSFFKAVLKLNSRYDLAAALRRAGIDPSTCREYLKEDVLGAIRDMYGVDVLLHCSPDGHLSEVWTCIDKDLQAIDCQASVQDKKKCPKVIIAPIPGSHGDGWPSGDSHRHHKDKEHEHKHMHYELDGEVADVSGDVLPAAQQQQQEGMAAGLVASKEGQVAFLSATEQGAGVVHGRKEEVEEGHGEHQEHDDDEDEDEDEDEDADEGHEGHHKKHQHDEDDDDDDEDGDGDGDDEDEDHEQRNKGHVNPSAASADSTATSDPYGEYTPSVAADDSSSGSGGSGATTPAAGDVAAVPQPRQRLQPSALARTLCIAGAGSVVGAIVLTTLIASWSRRLAQEAAADHDGNDSVGRRVHGAHGVGMQLVIPASAGAGGARVWPQPAEEVEGLDPEAALRKPLLQS